jgi:hypothetical protein
MSQAQSSGLWSGLAIGLRPPEKVMRLERLGAMHATRLSFARAMLRRVEQERWRVTRPVWALDGGGFGHAVYRVDTPARSYSLVAFSQPLAPEMRTDRVIAEAWDTSYVLYDGVPDAAEIARLAKQVPLQEAGRFAETELVLSRANKSVRLFETVVAALAAGEQPDAALLDGVGYLMRTTAVYGNGKFGIADRDFLAERPECAGPFRAEMLTVWLIRAFTADLADHCAAALSGQAVRLAPDLKRRLGVGNSTGLGMAPFLVRHPLLLNNWMTARETALARVRSLGGAEETAWTEFLRLVEEACAEVAGWHTEDELQAARIEVLRADLSRLAAFAGGCVAEKRSWDAVFRWAEAQLGLEAQDFTIGLLLEPHGALVDDLADRMDADERLGTAIDGAMNCATLRRAIEQHYTWALAIDFDAPPAQARFWYVSEEKLEPRLGERWQDMGAEREQPLAFGRDAARLRRALAEVAGTKLVASFLLDRPDQRHVVRRVQIAARYPYAEIRGNLVDATMWPVDLLRCKLAFFGATRFDPRSDRWLRINLFRNAPFPDELAGPAAC